MQDLRIARYSLREEDVNNFVGMHVVIDGATRLSYDTGVIISGKVLNSNLVVEGTLIVREGAEVSGTIQCDRLIALGAINCKRVVVKELAICWSGKLGKRLKVCMSITSKPAINSNWLAVCLITQN